MEKKDFNQIEKTFSKIENYYENESSPPVKTVKEVLSFWEEIKDQEIKVLDFKVLSIKNNDAEIGWIFEDQTGEYKGNYKIKFNKDLNCIEFRQVSV